MPYAEAKERCRFVVFPSALTRHCFSNLGARERGETIETHAGTLWRRACSAPLRTALDIKLPCFILPRYLCCGRRHRHDEAPWLSATAL